MRHLATSIALVAWLGATTGCAHRSQNYAALGVAGVSFGGALLIDHQNGDDGGTGCNDGPGCIAVPSGADLAGGLGLLRNYGDEHPSRARVAPPDAGPDRTLAAMRREALAYAADDDCARARVIADEIRATNVEYYRDRVAPDAIIGACLRR